MFEIDGSIISPEELTQKILRKVNAKKIPMEKSVTYGPGAEDRTADFEAIRQELNIMYENLAAMEESWVITEPIAISSKKVIGPAVVFVKKAIRKCLRWLLQPYFEQVAGFNGAATRALSEAFKVQSQIVDVLERMSGQEEDA